VNTTDVTAVTEVELVKIAKPVLLEACRKHPRIEDLLRGIYKPDNVEGCDRSWQTVRRSIRFGVPTQVEIVSQAHGNQGSDPLTGNAVDISSGGMCVDLGSAPPPEDPVLLKGRTVQSTLNLPDGVTILNISGKIVWQRVQETKKGANLLIGVRFALLNAADRELLIDYCTGNLGPAQK
jgi:hypothetical protein